MVRIQLSFQNRPHVMVTGMIRVTHLQLWSGLLPSNVQGSLHVKQSVVRIRLPLRIRPHMMVMGMIRIHTSNYGLVSSL
jgi:hypothetical protein